MHQAVSFLARRDHSVHELRQKLLKKGHDEETLEPVLDELQQRGYLDDRRYAQMILRHHYSRGQGPQKIRYLLNQQGISNSMMQDVFAEFEADWFELAADTRLRRFGDQFSSEDKQVRFKEKSRQMRFLMSRGFESEHIQYAMSLLDESA